MNAKNRADGKPNVIYLETELTEKFGEGFRVVCPITDPYVFTMDPLDRSSRFTWMVPRSVRPLANGSSGTTPSPSSTTVRWRQGSSSFRRTASAISW